MARPERAHLVRLFPPAEHGGVVVVPFEGARMTIGRGKDCSIQLDQSGVDLEHARVERPRSGTALRVKDLGSEQGTHVAGRHVPKKGADLPQGGILRVGEAIFLHCRWTEAAAKSAALPPLPGPVNSCHPTVASGLRRLQSKRFDAGSFWVCGPSGSGRSVVIEHLRALMEISSGGDWITGGATFETCLTPPPEAILERTLSMPRLRDRSEDLLVLITSLVGGVLPTMTPRLVEGLLVYDWPGNIRELRLSLARAHDPRFGAAPGTTWDLPNFPDCERFLKETTGGDDPLTLQTPERPLPKLAKEMRRLMDAHEWRIYQVAAASGRTRSNVLEHLFSLGIREPWERA
jgi:hypothetical protein